MSEKAKDCIIVATSLISSLVFSINIVFMYTGISNEYKYELNIVTGAVFWISILVMIITYVTLRRRQKSWCLKNGIMIRKKSKPEIFRFFSNGFAKVADALFILSVALFAYSLWVGRINGQSGMINYVATSMLIFTTYAHCMGNSKVFHYAMNQDKILRKLKRNNQAKRN